MKKTIKQASNQNTSNVQEENRRLREENAQLKYDLGCMQMDIDGYRGNFVPASWALLSPTLLFQNYYSMFNLLFDYIFDAQDPDKTVSMKDVQEARFAFDAIRGRQFEEPKGLNIGEQCEYYFGDKMIDEDTAKTFRKPLDYCNATHQKFKQPEHKKKRDQMVEDSGLLEKLGLDEDKIRRIRAIFNER